MYLTPWLLLLRSPVKFGVPQGFVLGPICSSLFINDLPLHMKNISVDCDMLADDTTLDTSGKYILQISSNMQDKLDQVSNWCNNNHNYGHQSDQDQVYDSWPAPTQSWECYGPNGKAGTTQPSFIHFTDASLRVLL